MSTYTFPCYNCRHPIPFNEGQRGDEVRCSSCLTRVIVPLTGGQMFHVAQPPVISSGKNDNGDVASKGELQEFIQARNYYYLPKWEALDPALRRVAPGTFNWAACFLTVFWMAYRRMYVYVFVWVAFLFIFYSIIELVFTIPPSAINGVNLTMMFLFGRYGSSLYRKHVERKIRQIKATLSPEYWAQAFRDKGGTSFWAPIPLVILHLLTLYGMYLSIVEKARQ